MNRRVRSNNARFKRYTALVLGLLLCACNGSPYEIEALVPPSTMHGVHGLAFDSRGRLLAASLVGQSIYRIDVASGDVETVAGPPDGNADDVAVAPDGTIAWTAGLTKSVMALSPSGERKTLAANFAGANSLAYSKDGRLFATTIFGGDALYELDPTGAKPPRLIADKLGGLNGFEITPDNVLYGPLYFRGKIVKVNLADGTASDVADGFTMPAAVNFDSTGALYAVDNRTGEVFEVNVATGEKRLIVKLDTPIDNLAVGTDDNLYVSSPAFNRVSKIDPVSGAVTDIVRGGLSSPGGIAIIEENGREQILVADFWGHRTVDAQTGDVRMMATAEPVGGSIDITATHDLIILSSIWPFKTVQLIDRRTGELLGRVGDLGVPYDVVALTDGRLLIADYGKGELVAVNSDDPRRRDVIASGLQGPVGLAVADADTVYVSEWDGGIVSRVALKDGARTVVRDGLDHPEGLAIDVQGRLIVAETGAQRLIAFASSAGDVEIIAANLAMGLKGWSGMPAPFIPSGVAIAGDGSIYVTADIDNGLYKISAR